MALNKIKTSSIEDDSITSVKLAPGAVTNADIPNSEITMDKLSQVDLTIAPEVLEIQVDAPAAGQDSAWLWTWLTSSLPYARRTITNSPEISVPLYKQGTYTVNNYAAYDLHGSMTQTHTLYFKWIDGAGTDNLVSWATSAGPVSDSHPDINGGAATDVQRINIAVPGTVTPPTLTAPNVSYTVTNNGTGAYTFSGSASGDNPNIGPFYRGGTYTFNVSAVGHPFYFTTDNGTNFSAGAYFGEYTTGVTGSRTDSGTVTITVDASAPNTLYYQCGNHSGMRGVITVKDLAVETNINGNYIVYAQHTQEGHKTPVEIRPIPSLVNQMCLVYDATSGKFVPQDLATYVENTPSFENKIREVAGTAELVVEDGSAVIAKVNVYDDSTYLPLVGNNPGDQAFATDTDILYIWDGSAWQQAGAANTDDLAEGSTNLFYTDTRVGTYLSSNGYDTASNIIASITDSAPTTLDTLNELAAALGDDPNFATTVTNSIANKLSLSGGTLTGDLIMDSSTKLSVGNPSPLSKLQVGGDPITTTIPIVTISETTDGASLLLRGQSPTLIFDQTSGGHGRIIQDGVDLSFYDGDFDNPGNVIMTVGTDSVSFNKQPILPKVSSPNTPYEGGLYYDIDDNTAKFYNGTDWIPMGGDVNRYNYTATAGQTSFTASYTPGNVDVYLNGTKLTRTADYTDTSGTAVVLTTGADVGDLIDIVAFTAYSVSDAVSASGGTFTGTVDFNQNIFVGTKINVGIIPNTTAQSNASIHIHKSFATSSPVTLDEAPSIILSENETSGAGSQGYHGAYWFGSQDTNTPSDYNWKVAGIASQGGDTEGANADGNLEFYTTSNNSSPTKNMTLGTGGQLSIPNQCAFEMIKTTDTTGNANANNYIRYDTVQFETGGSGCSTSTGLYTAPADGLYHFSISFTATGGTGTGDDSVGVGFVIGNNTYYTQDYSPNIGHRINPVFDTSGTGIEHTYSFQKTARLSAGATIGFYVRDWDDTSTVLQHAEFGGYKFA